MINKLVRQLLKVAAQTLVRYANSIETYLAKEQISETKSVSEVSLDIPPAHWLEKIRQGAPHLLDEISGESETAFVFFETEESDAQLCSNSYSIKKNEHNKKYFLAQPGHKKLGNIFKFLAKYISAPFSSSKTMFSRNEKKSLNPVKCSIKKSKQPIFDTITNKNRMTASFKTASSANAQNSALSFQETDKVIITNKNTIAQTSAINDSNIIQKKTRVTDETQSQAKTIDKIDIMAKSRRYDSKLSEHTHIKNKPILNLHPKSTSLLEPVKIAKDNHVKIIAEKRNIHSVFSKDRKTTTFDSVDQQKLSSINDYNQIIYSDSHFENINNHKITSHTQQKNLGDSPSLKSNHRFDTKKSQESNSQWPNLPNESLTQSNQDRWPQLPTHEKFESKTNLNQPFVCWHLQEQIKSNSLSEQEQRGYRWNV